MQQLHADAHALSPSLLSGPCAQGYLIGKARHEEIFGIIERSNFTLTPRGHGSASWRMYEALQLGSIPIYQWDYDPLVPYTVSRRTSRPSILYFNLRRDGKFRLGMQLLLNWSHMSTPSVPKVYAGISSEALC